MIRGMLAATSFFTRLPVAARAPFTAQEIGRSAGWFPLVGAAIGGVYILIWRAFSPIFPAAIVAVLIVAAEALLTGALHFDGVADMADGFGGGRTREDVLRIMRDHAIGAYGALALILLVIAKIVSIAALMERRRAAPFLVLAPALGRWSAVLLSKLLPYARRAPEEGAPSGGAISDFVGGAQLCAATATQLLITLVLAGWRGMAVWITVACISWAVARLCRKRIGGITGDTLGANVELCEVGVLFTALALR